MYKGLNVRRARHTQDEKDSVGGHEGPCHGKMLSLRAL